MARVFTFPNFLGSSSTGDGPVAGGATIPAGQWTGFAIGPGSEVASCKILGVSLGVGAVLPMRTEGSVQISATGGRPSLAQTASRFAIGKLLEIVAFEPCDSVAPIGIRAPRVVSNRRDMNGTAAYTDILQVPYEGRRAARIHLLNTDVGTAFDWIVVGRSYPPRPFDVDQVLPLETTLISGTYTAAAAVDSLAANVGATIIVGGTDNFETFDSVHLFARYVAGAGARILTSWIEAYDSAEGF